MNRPAAPPFPFPQIRRPPSPDAWGADKPALPPAAPLDRAFEASDAAIVPALDSFWRAHTAGWIFIGLFGLTARSMAYYDLPLSIVLTAILDPLGFFMTALAHKAYLARRGSPIVTLQTVMAALGLSVVGGIIQMLVAGQIRAMMMDGAMTAPSHVDSAVVTIVYYIAIFLGWSIAYFWLKTDADARTERFRRIEAQAAAMRAELNQLRLQLDPHFLFNALNTVAAEIPERPEAALEMTHRIADYLRYSLDHHARGICPLADEIDAVRAYMRIQELRFEGRLDCVVDVDPAAEAVAVPHLILQPLVENAVKHGLRSPVERLKMRVSVSRQGDDVIIEVSNPGRLDIRERDRPAVGLANIRRRLELHYPRGHALSLVQLGDMVVARLMVRGEACFA